VSDEYACWRTLIGIENVNLRDGLYAGNNEDVILQINRK